MHALILDAENPGKSLGEGGLGDAGHTLQQDVASGQKGDEKLMRDVFHADHNLGDFNQGLFAQVANSIRPLLQSRTVEVGSWG